MARANYESSDDELPELSSVLRRRQHAATASRPPLFPSTPAAAGGTPARAAPSSALGKQVLVPKTKSSVGGSRRQRVLKTAADDSRLLGRSPASQFGTIAPLEEDEPRPARRRAALISRTPARAAKKPAKYTVESDESDDTQSASESAEDVEDMEESIWCGTDDSSDDVSAGGDDDGDDDEAEYFSAPDTPTRNRPRDGVEPAASSTANSKPAQPLLFPMSGLPGRAPPRSGDVPPRSVSEQPAAPSASVERPSSSYSADDDAVLRYSPPRRVSPHKLPAPSGRPSTPPPPSSPSKSRLVSPSKKTRIPTPPHRPSLDAFWSAEVVNSWNDQHSPRKTLKSGQEDEPGGPASPRKQSPTKKDPSAARTRRSFEQRKHQLANDFLKELDEQITGGDISALAAECGGVKLIWSKTLNTTAGRANWKRETLRTQDNGAASVRYRHHASIELAEKVIDDEDRLVNVIAHEYCHLANFMISNVRDSPHGKEFKEWAKKVTRAFGHRNVSVTTKHTYAIDYKYTWACVSCGHEFKRHSKSINPAKHRCGSCKAELVQTKPAVRQKDPSKGPSEYQVFMKANFQRIKRENEGKGHKEIMEMLGREYREHKSKKGTSAPEADLASVTKAIETIALDD